MVGLAGSELKFAVKPKVVEAPVARLPFHSSFATAITPGVDLFTPDQTDSGEASHGMLTSHEEVAGPLFVTVTLTVAPLDHPEPV